MRVALGSSWVTASCRIGTERIIETFYRIPMGSWRITADYQLVVNPAYNRDRGPVSALAIRVHTQF